MSPSRSRLARWIFLALLGGMVAVDAMAAPSVSDLDQRIQQIEKDTSLSPELKAKLLGAYARAQEFQRQAEEARKRAQALGHSEKTAEKRLQQLRDRLAAFQLEPIIPQLEDAPTPRLEEALAQAQATLRKARDQKAKLDKQVNEYTERRQELPKRIAEARQRLQELKSQLSLLPTVVENEPLATALRIQFEEERDTLTAQIKAYEQELESYRTRYKRLMVQRELATKQAKQAEERVATLEKWLTVRHKQELGSQLAETKIQLRQAAQTHPYLVQLAQGNNERLIRREQLVAQIKQVTARAETLSNRLNTLREDFDRIKERVSAVGLTPAVGLLLRKQRDKLPNLRRLQRQRNALQDQIGEARLELMEIADRRARLADLDRVVEERLAQLDPPLEDQAERAELEPALRELLETRREYTHRLEADLNRYFDQLVKLDTQFQRLIAEARAFARYIDENVLWIPSGSLLGGEELSSLGAAGRWLLAWENWSRLVRHSWEEIESHPSEVAWILVGLGVLFYLRKPFRRQLEGYMERIRQVPGEAFRLGLFALLITVVMALPESGLLWLGGWWLVRMAEGTQFETAVGIGLQRTAFVWFILQFLAQLTREKGVAEGHFRWRPETLSLLFYHTYWMKVVFPPLVFLSSVFTAQPNEAWRESFGRLAFILTMLVLASVVYRLIGARRNLFTGILQRQPNSWFARLHWLWVSLAIGVPAALAMGAASGYFFTAAQLQDRVFFSAWVVVGMILVKEMIRRWLVEEQKGLAREQTRKRRERGELTEEVSWGPVEVAEEEYDFRAINTQTRKFLSTVIGFGLFLGLGMIWVPILPALSWLNQITLWTDPNYDAPVTLASLGLAIVIVALTVVAAKNIAGVLEIAALNKLPLAASTRYAITTVARYLITVVGTVFAFGVLGIGWSKVQWLVAAISVGLGFGLQEIFANFVSGLILLFEQPIRVGDTVTINGTSGTVSRIRIRATTIIDWDRKELVVPNKSFVTGDLINWTLSDTLLRVIIPVGIAYGSDVIQAERTLYRLAQEQEYVLDDPAPQVFFLGFGESSLKFELRFFIPMIEHLLPAQHALCVAIDQAFREAGIEIALPQRDLHIRSIDQALSVEQAVSASRTAPEGSY